MATYTSNYGWTKPEGSDPVDIGVLNGNLDSQDNIVHNAYMQLAPVFSASATYAVDDVVLYANNLYKCITAVTVAGDWDSTKWTQVKVSDIAGGGGGGTSDYSQLTNKPSINSVTLSGNKTSADLGLQDAIQLDTMPTASATYDGKIVQYVGTTTASYTHGYYYECINNGGTYAWTQLNVQPSSGGTSDYTQLTNKPSINSVTLSGNKTSADLGLQDAIQLATMPTAGATYVGKVVQFVGVTDATYTHGYYYECTNNGGTYSWVQTNVQPSNGGGHTIVNGAGTSMSQRNALQFKGGLAVSDDSTNERTVVSDEYELITWADWQTIVANHEEDLHPNAIITGAPDADGDVSVDLMTKLWENPSPTAAFPAQSIELSSGDYDMLLWLASYDTSSVRIVPTLVIRKGESGYAVFPDYDNGVANRFRTFTYVDTTHYSVTRAYRNGTVDNNSLIPIVIYGIKTTASVKVSAIAESVSTSADKCMLSDGVTSVEDRLDANTFGTVVDISAYTSANPYVAPSDGYTTIALSGGGSMGDICVEGVSLMRINAYSGNNYPTASVFVKKGMHVYLDILAGVGSGAFHPLS